MRKLLTTLALAAALLVPWLVFGALPQTVNPSSPTDMDPLSQGAGKIRETRQYLIDILGIPNNTAVNNAAFGIATDGRVNFPSGVASSTAHLTGYLKANASKPVTAQTPPIPAVDGGTGRDFTGTTGLFYWNNGVAQTYAGVTCTTQFLRGLNTTGTGPCASITAADLPSGTLTATATQADMEAASSTTAAVTPGRTQYHPGVAKAWASVAIAGGTPTLQASYNVTSIMDDAPGQTTVTFTNALTTATYSAQATIVDSAPAAIVQVDVRSTTSLRTHLLNSTNGVDTDDRNFTVAVWGDQ